MDSTCTMLNVTHVLRTFHLWLWQPHIPGHSCKIIPTWHFSFINITHFNFKWLSQWIRVGHCFYFITLHILITQVIFDVFIIIIISTIMHNVYHKLFFQTHSEVCHQIHFQAKLYLFSPQYLFISNAPINHSSLFGGHSWSFQSIPIHSNSVLLMCLVSAGECESFEHVQKLCVASANEFHSCLYALKTCTFRVCPTAYVLYSSHSHCILCHSCI